MELLAKIRESCVQSNSSKLKVLSTISFRLNKSASAADMNSSSRSSVLLGQKPDDNSAYSFTIEECILAAHYATSPKCPSHGSLALSVVAPDTVRF